MALNKEQISKLFLFVEKKQVKWYDLQVELVDHLANKIEEEIETNPSIHFEAALGKVYASFGIFGFARIVKEKEAQVRKQNNKLWNKEFKNQFVWPNLMRSLALLLIINLLVKHVSKDYILLLFFVVAISISVVQVVLNKRIARNKKKILLTQDFMAPSFLAWMNVQILINSWQFGENKSVFYSNNIQIAIIFLNTISYLVTFKVSLKIYEKAKDLYPEAFGIA